MSRSVAPPDFLERLRVPLSIWAFFTFMVATFGIALVVVVAPEWALLVAVVLELLGAWFFLSSTATVEVRDGELRAGRAHIPASLLGPVTALDADTAAHLRGPGIDPRAYHLLRSSVKTAVRADVRDPGDPTPYWYVSTRRPKALVAALAQAGAAVSDRPVGAPPSSGPEGPR